MKRGAIVATALGTLAVFSPSAGQTADITVWSHWADQQTKVRFVEEVAARFKARNPGSDVKITWYQKNPLNAAVKAALQAGQGPDIFYCEPAQTEYVEAGFALDLTDKLDWNNVEPWARSTWEHNGRTYALPLEAFTVELYYNRDLLRQLGVSLPESKQLTASAFADLVKAARTANITPIVQGVGDRPFPGAYLPHELILKAIGTEDYGRLLRGSLSWRDPRVVAALRYMEGLVKAGAHPPGFSTLKLGESHFYFYQRPGGLMLPMGSWYTSRAFNPPDQGGQPEGFPLGIMKVPAPDGAACPECKTASIGGSYCVNADSRNQALAVDFLRAMATPEMGTKWLVENLVQTGIRSDASQVTGTHRTYFNELQAINEGAKYFVGIPDSVMQGQCRESFRQVINAAFPAGQISTDRAVQMMDQACFRPS